MLKVVPGTKMINELLILIFLITKYSYYIVCFNPET